MKLLGAVIGVVVVAGGTAAIFAGLMDNAERHERRRSERRPEEPRRTDGRRSDGVS